MTLDSYQSWLVDRGISAPGSQPFQLVASHIHCWGSTVILASAPADESDSIVTSVARLSDAISKLFCASGGDDAADSASVSWLVVRDELVMPSLELLKSLCPRLQAVIDLTGAGRRSETTSHFEMSYVSLPQADVSIVYGPKIGLMNQDPALKKAFWVSLQDWIAMSQKGLFS